MKKSRFYPTVWQAMADPFGAVGQWDNNGRRIKEIVLKNDAVPNLGFLKCKLT